jgi:hypothetical protein
MSFEYKEYLGFAAEVFFFATNTHRKYRIVALWYIIDTNYGFR